MLLLLFKKRILFFLKKIKIERNQKKEDLIFFLINYTIICHVATKKLKKITKIHVEVTRRRHVEILRHVVQLGRYHRESSVCKGGISKKNITRGYSKTALLCRG
jgi:hypothetical protein